MNNSIITMKYNKIDDIIITNHNIHINNSYKIKKKKDMECLLSFILLNTNNFYQTNRNIKSLVREWRVHNICYALHIARKRTKDVDLQSEHSFFIEFLYNLLGRL